MKKLTEKRKLSGVTSLIKAKDLRFISKVMGIKV